ncbi:MAG: acyl-CoA dehydrogenase family protein [Hyphomonadaceae bacterium]
MEFALSEDQRMLQSSIVGTLENVSSLEHVRRVAAGELDVAATVNAALGELGAGQLLVPEQYGGLGLGALEAALIQEALGHAVSPGAFLAGAMAIIAIRGAGSEAQQAHWLGGICAGESTLGVALTEAVSARDGAGITSHDTKLSGKALFAFEVDAASHVLTADAAGALFIVDLSAKGVSTTPLGTIDKTRSYTELMFDGVEAEPLSSESSLGDTLVQVLALGRILFAADTLGACQNMLEKAVAYAAERKQFGRVIGSFQAVKHMCAEMAAKLEPCRALVWHSAYLFDTDPAKAALMSCLTKSHMSEVGTFVARTSTEVHGGMGFTDLVGLHYWFKRIGVNRQWLGGPEALRLEAARLQGWA